MKKQTVIQLLIILILLAILSVLSYKTVNVYKSDNSSAKNTEMKGPGGEMNGGNNSQSVNAQGAFNVTDSQSLSGEYTSTNSDESAILVSDGGSLELNNSQIKKSGDSSNTENSEFYGINAGILTTKGSTTTIKNSNIETSSKGSNAVFATGTDAKVYISDSTITTTGESSARGLDATYGGYIEADNVTNSTAGGSCAALATDRGEGTVIARNSNLKTAGRGSPIIYSTGDITLESSKGSATGSQVCVIEGKNTATIKNSVISSSGKGNRNDVDNCGVMIYQSMSGDADEGTGTFNCTDSTLEITSDSTVYKTAPFFFITNTNAVINLENTVLNFGSGILLNAEGTSEWGKSGSNAGNVVFNAKKQKLLGNIVADSISSVELNLSESSYFEGKINTDNTAKEVSLKISSNSKIRLTGDSYVTSLTDEDSTYSNIDFNGYNLYVNGELVNK